AQLRFLHIHVVADTAARKRTDARTDKHVLELVTFRQKSRNGTGRSADPRALDCLARLRFARVRIDGRASSGGKHDERAHAQHSDEWISHSLVSPVLLRKD